jgi:hypothetical protein
MLQFIANTAPLRTSLAAAATRSGVSKFRHPKYRAPGSVHTSHAEGNPPRNGSSRYGGRLLFVIAATVVRVVRWDFQ